MAVFFTRRGKAASLYDKNTLLLLHCDDFTDSSMYGNKVTSSGVTIDRSKKKFGDGSFYNASTTTKVTIPYNGVFEFGTGDFTVEFWLYILEYTRDAQIFTGNVNNAFFVGFTQGGYFGIGRAAIAWDGYTSETVAKTYNTWMHLAAVRKDGTVYLFKDGKLLKSFADTQSYGMLGGETTIPTQMNDFGLKCYIDELRVSNVARWTGNFTPPTEAYRA